MKPEELIKIAMDAYDDETQKLAFASYFENDTEFTKESAEAFAWLDRNLYEVEKVALDKVSEELMADHVKLAVAGLIRGGMGLLGKFLGRAGGAASGASGKLLARAAAPSRSFSKMMGSPLKIPARAGSGGKAFVRPGRSPAQVQHMWGNVQQAGGAAGWMRGRSMQRARAAMAARSAGRAGARGAGRSAPIRATAQSMGPIPGRGVGGGGGRGMIPYKPSPGAAGGAGARAGKGMWGDIKSGLLWGGGFQLASNMLGGGTPETQYRMG